MHRFLSDHHAVTDQMHVTARDIDGHQTFIGLVQSLNSSYSILLQPRQRFIDAGGKHIYIYIHTSNHIHQTTNVAICYLARQSHSPLRTGAQAPLFSLDSLLTRVYRSVFSFLRASRQFHQKCMKTTANQHVFEVRRVSHASIFLSLRKDRTQYISKKAMPLTFCTEAHLTSPCPLIMSIFYLECGERLVLFNGWCQISSTVSASASQHHM